MDAEITIKNYRCFPDQRPAVFRFRPGFSAFLGVNNSGKSSLLKFFYEFRQLFGLLSNFGNLNPTPLKEFRGFNFQGISDVEEVFTNYNPRDMGILIRLIPSGDISVGEVPSPHFLVLNVPRATNKFTLEFAMPGKPIPYRDAASIEFVGSKLRIDGKVEADFSHFESLFRDLASTVYIGPFRNAINIGLGPNYFDIQVGQSFIQSWRDFKTGASKRQNEAIYKLTDDIRRIFQFRELEINPSPNLETLKFLINGRSYTLSELGSGLAQFVLVLANAATRQPAYILIDEPELNLHPSLQLDFLTTLGSYAGKGVLFGTHSYGLARARAHQVYTLRYDQDAGSEVRPLESTPRLSELLGELSYSAYRELGFDKILLVEGVTDVLTVQQFLRIYQKDHQIVLLPLGGEAMINAGREQELREITRISPNVFALIDSERSAQNEPLKKSRKDFVDACQRAGICACKVLDRRATENYLTEAAVKSVKGSNFQGLAPFQELKGAKPAWSKEENWRIARAMTREDLDNTDLGQFLASL